MLPSTLVKLGDYSLVQKDCGSQMTILASGPLSELTEIGEHVFETDQNLNFASLEFPSVEKIGSYAFSLISGSYYFDFSGAPLSIIEDYAFYWCSASLKIQTAVCSNIGVYNSGLGKHMIKESDISPLLTTIPTGLDPQVTSLPATVTKIETNAFNGIPVSNFMLSANLSDISVTAFPKGSTFIVDAGTYAELWCRENGFGYTINGQEDDLSWLN